MTHTIDHERAREVVHELSGLAAQTDAETPLSAYQNAVRALLAAVGADVLGDADMAAEAMLAVKIALRAHTEAVTLDTLHWLDATEEACFEAWRTQKHTVARRLGMTGVDRYGKHREANDDLPGGVDDVALDAYGDS